MHPTPYTDLHRRPHQRAPRTNFRAPPLRTGKIREPPLMTGNFRARPLRTGKIRSARLGTLPAGLWPVALRLLLEEKEVLMFRNKRFRVEG